MNNSVPERLIFQCALSKNFEREMFTTRGYIDSHIIAQALRLCLEDKTSVILPDLYLQILQYIEIHKITLANIAINDRESVLSQNLSKVFE